MSIATALYRELTGSDDRDAYAPPLYACLIALVFMIPWARVLRVLGFTILVCVALVILAL